MKKHLLSLLMGLAIVAPATAQDSGSDDPPFHFGLKASPIFSWIRPDADHTEGDGLRIGFTYGLMTEFRITKNYAFATGVEIAYRGGKYKETIVNGFGITLANIKVTQKLQFVEIPVALKLKTNEIGYMKYYGIFGVTPALMVKAIEDKESDNQAVVENRNSRGNQSEFSSFNLSLLVGAGIEYSLGGNTAFTAGLHYNNGLLDVWKISDRQMRVDGITLNIGVFF